jgi:hypothetical protein
MERVTRVRLRTWLIVFALGALAQTAWFLIRPVLGPLFSSQGYYGPKLYNFTYGFTRPLLALFVPFGLALLAWRRGQRVPIRWIVGGAIVLHLLLLFAPTPQSQDIHQYLFYGRMQVLHTASPSQPAAYAGNPYVILPSNAASDSWYSWIRWPNQTTVYGPVWNLVSYWVALAAGGSHTAGYLLMKLVVFALDLSVMRMIFVAARDRPDPESFAGFGLLAYAWNPLILISVPLGGLVDIALAAGLVGGFLAARKDRTWLATVLFILTALVKVYAGIGLLLWLLVLLRRDGARRAAAHAGLAVAISAIAFAPYWAGTQTFHGLFHVVTLSNHSLVGVLQRLLTPVLRVLGSNVPYQLAGAILRWLGLGLLAASVIWAVRRTRSARDLPHSTLAVLAVYCLFTPWFFYWYLVAPLAIVAMVPEDRLAAPILTASGTLLFATAFRPWLLGQAVEVMVRYAPPMVVFGRGLRAGPKERVARDVRTASGQEEQEEEAPAAAGGGALSATTAAS